MKKVILLSDRPGIDESSMIVLKEVARVIEENGLEAEIMTIAHMEAGDIMLPNSLSKDESKAILDEFKCARGLIVAEPVYMSDVRSEILTVHLFKDMEILSTQYSMIKGEMTGDALADEEGLKAVEGFAELAFFLIDESDWNTALSKFNKLINKVNVNKSII